MPPLRPRTSTRGTDVTYLIFVGDMLVMAFMVGLVVWVGVRANAARHASAARIPLEDERDG